MKLKTTKKYIKNEFKNIICVGYCELQCLLRYFPLVYYTAGVYGWNADVYIIDCDTVIVTGYNPFGNIRAEHTICKEYEDAAKDVTGTIEDVKRQLHSLLNDFVTEVTNC